MKPGLLVAITFLLPTVGAAEEWNEQLKRFAEESCIGCHDADTETRLDLTSLGYDLENDQVFRAWVNVFDRVERGEMPPASETRPSEESRRTMLSLLKAELTRVNRYASTNGWTCSVTSIESRGVRTYASRFAGDRWQYREALTSRKRSGRLRCGSDQPGNVEPSCAQPAQGS